MLKHTNHTQQQVTTLIILTSWLLDSVHAWHPSATRGEYLVQISRLLFI